MCLALKHITLSRLQRAAALNGLREWLAPDLESSRSALSIIRARQDGAVILVSRLLAPWLADDAFISSVLDAANLASGPKKRKLSVLAAAVDEVPCFDPDTGSFGSSEGISVLLGRAKYLMPRLWCPEDAPTTPQQAQQASLDFRLCQVAPLKVTVPVANTLFTADKRHVLFASRWLAGATHGLELVEKAEKTKATLQIWPKNDQKPARLLANLIPVTRPRKVLASLGNILSKIEIGGQPAPPSQELETILPGLLNARRERLGGSHTDSRPPSSIGVWALTIPKTVLDIYPMNMEADWQQYGWNRLLEAGCHFSKVGECICPRGRWFSIVDLTFGDKVSGGGGWGLKQGLLSLDPQTTFDTDEDRDLQQFMKSFQGEASPESFVQFFIEGPHPSRITNDPSWGSSSTSTTVIGTPGAIVGSAAAMAGGVSACPGLFGAVSEAGVYLESQGDGETRHAIATKLDASRSYVVMSPASRKSSDAAFIGRDQELVS